MDLLDFVLLGVIAILGHQLFLGFNRGRIYGRNSWSGYSTGWISREQQPSVFFVTVATYSAGFIGAVVVIAMKALG